MTETLLDRPLFPPALLAAARAAGVLAHDPDDAAAPEAARLAALAREYDRPWLAATLAAYQTRIGADATAVAAAERLADARCTVVVTGQQAGLWSGPLYTIYKIIGAIRQAQALETASGEPVVPIFWNATEDHDLSEIATAAWPERQWQAAFSARGQAASALPLAPAAEAVQAMLAALPAEADAAAIAALLAPTGADYGEYSSAVIARLFAGTGLVVLEPRLLRARQGDLFARALTERAAIAAGLAAGEVRLTAAGIDVSFPAGDGTGVWRLDATGRRSQVFARDGGLWLDGKRQDLESLLQAATAAPETFSTGAFLRPIWQGHTLPVAAYIAGPGELRYHLQLTDVFSHFDVPMPLLLPRPQATILPAREQRMATQLGVEGDGIFRPARDFRNQRGLPLAVDAAFAHARNQLSLAEDQLAAAIADVLPPETAGAAIHRQVRELERLQARTLREYRRKHGVDNGRVDRLFAVLQPQGQPQERVLNITYLLARCGPDLIPQLLATLDPAERRHHLIFTD